MTLSDAALDNAIEVLNDKHDRTDRELDMLHDLLNERFNRTQGKAPEHLHDLGLTVSVAEVPESQMADVASSLYDAIAATVAAWSTEQARKAKRADRLDAVAAYVQITYDGAADCRRASR